MTILNAMTQRKRSFQSHDLVDEENYQTKVLPFLMNDKNEENEVDEKLCQDEKTGANLP